MTLTWRDLFMTTLRNPAGAAQIVLSTNVSRTDIYLALIAGAALNTVLMGMTLLLFPLPEAWPGFISHPLSYFVIASGGLILFAHLLTWSGRGMGGVGTLDDMLKLMIWLQFVRIALQLVGLVITIALPPLGGLYSLAVTGVSLWIVLNFIQVGHGLETLGKALVVLFITFVGLIVGLSLLLALLGGGMLGVSSNV